jgi:hypothetical protein
MNRSGPGGDDAPAQAIQCEPVKMAFLNLDKSGGAAISVSGWTIELAWTTPGAIAVHTLDSFHFPLNIVAHILLVCVTPLPVHWAWFQFRAAEGYFI